MHAERLVHKLIPANDKQRKAVEVARRMIWWFYRALKEYKLAPSPEKAERLRAQFDRIFDRSKTGYATLDSLLRRLFRLKDGSKRPALGRARACRSLGGMTLAYYTDWPTSFRITAKVCFVGIG